MKYTVYCYCIFLFLFAMGASDKVVVPDMEPLTDEMTSDLLVMLSNETKDYKPSSVKDMMNATRRQWFWWSEEPKFVHYGHGWKHIPDKLLACYFTAVTYRTAMKDLRNYFDIRFLYTNTLEFEVGYLTHEIIYRYQIVLELYQMAERRFMPHQNMHYASGSYMLYIYTNILEQCNVIIHLCNMLHEIEKKYIHHNQIKHAKKSVFDDYFDPQNKEDNITKVRHKLEMEQRAYELYLKRKKQLERKQAKAKKQYYSQFAKFGITTTRKTTTPKKSEWPMVYGWSIEVW